MTFHPRTTSKTETSQTTGDTVGEIIYVGERSTGGEVAVTRRTHNASGTVTMARPVPLRLDLRNHSPTGFEWGYGGSGPAQLALALLADVLNDAEQALLLYQAFKWKTVALFPTGGWQMSREEMQRIVRVLQAEQRTKAQVRQAATVEDAAPAP